MSTNTTPLKIIGKEFLYDENLFITNYNPFDSRNTSGFSGLQQTKTFTGKLYIFDKTNYNEPTKNEFKLIKKVSDLDQFKKASGIATINYFNISINTTYDLSTKIRTLDLDKTNSGTIIVPNIGSQSPTIFDSSFAVLLFDKDTTNTFDKSYNDITTGESNFMWLIPSEFIKVNISNTDGVTLILSDATKRNVTKLNSFATGPFEEIVPGFSQDVASLYSRNTQLNSSTIPDNLTWVAQTDLPEYGGWAKFIIHNNFAYYIGGWNGTGQNTTQGTSKIRRASIDENGVIGTYIDLVTTSTTTGVLPNGITSTSLIILNNKLWIFGSMITGSTNTYLLNSYWCNINPDGTLGLWNSGPALPDYSGIGVLPAVVNNKMYLFGGYTSTGPTYKNHIICADIDSNGTIQKFYKIPATLLYPVADVQPTFVYGNKIFVVPGYNRTTAAYDSGVYSFVVNPDGSLQTMTKEIDIDNTYCSKQILIGNKLWIIGGYSIASAGYSAKVSVCDLSINSAGQVSISTPRVVTNFPIAMHGVDGVLITKNYIYLYPMREGTTWVNTKKVYRADISAYNIGSKNDYSNDSFHYENIVTLPNFVGAGSKNPVLNNSFVDGSITLDISDLVSEAEILDYVNTIKVNGNALTDISSSDLIIEPAPTTNSNKVQIILSEAKLQTLKYKTDFKDDIFGDGSCKAYYQFNSNLFDNIRKVEGDPNSVKPLANLYGYGVRNFDLQIPSGRTTWLGSPSNAAAPTQFLGCPHGDSTIVTVSAYINWNGQDVMIPFGLDGTTGKQAFFFYQTFVGINSANADVYGISSSGFANTWKHVVVQFNTGSYGKLWVDGVAQTLTQRKGTPIVGNQTVANQNLYLFLKDYANFGAIDNMRVFNRALTDLEVKALYRESSTSLQLEYNKPFVKDPAYPALTDKYITTIETKTKTNYINGRPWEQQYYIDRTDSESTTPLTFSLDTSLPFVCGWGEVAVIKNKVYIFGGSRHGGNNLATNVSTINVAPINSDGSIGTFTVSPSVLPAVMQQPKILLIGERLYLFGGVNTVYLATVYSCPVNSDGTLGAWRTETSLPYVSVIPEVFVTKNRLYLIGGNNGTTIQNTIYTSVINEDGTLGAWINTGTTFPVLTYDSSIIQIKNKIYVIGGIASITTWTNLNGIYVATINNDGTLTPFTTYGTFPTTIAGSKHFVTKNRVYIIGGAINPTTGIATNQVYSASIDANGVLGTWVAGNPLAYTDHTSANLVVTSGYVYILGGREYVSSGIWKDTAKVQRAPISGGKNDYINDTFTTTEYQVQVTKTNCIEQKSIEIIIPPKVNQNTPLVKMDSIVFDYDAKPEAEVIALDTGSSFFELQQLASPQNRGILFSTGKKAYLYGGRSDNSAAITQTISNTMWVSNILSDGRLEGFQNVGTNPLNLNGVGTYTYTSPLGETFVYLFGGITPGLTTNMNTTNSIKRALVLEDGSITNWSQIDTLPMTSHIINVVPNPEDPSYLYLFMGDSYSAGTWSSNRNKVCHYKIDTDGSLKLIATVTLNENYVSNASFIARDPKDNFQYLFMFGTEYSGDNNIRKYRIHDNMLIAPSYPIIIGTIDHAKHGTTLLEDSNNVYIIGGLSNTTTWKIAGDNRVLKYTKTDLINADPYNLISPILLPNLSIPVMAISDTILKTDYATYLICPSTTSITDGTSYAWQTTNKILGFRTDKTSLSSSLELKDTTFDIVEENTKLLPNKLNYRLKEELYTGLIVKESQTLSNFGEAIKFKDPITNIVYTLTEATKPNLISKLEEIFLEWLNIITKNTSLDKYNDYYYTNSYGLNTAREYNILVPEIIFNLLTDKNMININRIVLDYYLNINPLINYTDLYTKFISYGYTDTDFNISNILKTFNSSKINTDIRIPLTTDSNKMVLPKFNNINYNPLKIDYNFIFIPQKNKNKEICGSTLPSLYSDASYFDATGSCVYKKKPNFDEVYNEVLVDPTLFDYYISPTGKNSNPGTITLPKQTIGACPDGSKVLLLPGTYSQLWTYDTYYGTIPLVFQGMSNHMVFGCGDRTIINCVGTWQGRDKHLVISGGSGGRICNFKVNWSSEGSIGYENALIHNAAGGFCIIGVNFNFTPSNPYYSLNYNNNGGTIYYYECSFINGSRVGNYSGSQSLIATMPDWYRSMVNTIANISPASLAASTFAAHYNKLISTVEFTPAYTLIPITDDSNPDSNSIILETTSNITAIPNFEFKI